MDAAKTVKKLIPDISEDLLDKFVQALETELEPKNEEISKLQEQLTAANEQIKEFEKMDIDKIKESAAAWQEKYTASETAWKEKVAALKYSAAAKDAIADLKFSSNSAKKAFLSDLEAKKLPMENDKLTGFSDFLAEYKEADPAAFVQENQKNPPHLPGSGRDVNLNTQNGMDAAQKAFATRGVDFASVKKFNNINKGVN